MTRWTLSFLLISLLGTRFLFAQEEGSAVVEESVQEPTQNVEVEEPAPTVEVEPDPPVEQEIPTVDGSVAEDSVPIDPIDSEPVEEPTEIAAPPQDSLQATEPDSTPITELVDSTAKASTDSGTINSMASDSLSPSDSLDMDVVETDTTGPALSDSMATIEPVDSASLREASPVTKPKKKREAVYRSSKINTIDEMKGQYKSPKKAMFMSLLVPGLGQAYIGGIANYIRSGVYVAIEGGLFIGWHHFVVTKHNRQVKKYRRFADEHWSHRRFEETIDDVLPGLETPAQRDAAFPTREAFCKSVFGNTDGGIGEECTTFGNLDDISQVYADLAHVQFAFAEPGTTEEIGAYRKSNYSDLHDFYELVGKHNEYLSGWSDYDASGFDSVFSGESDLRTEYRGMRQVATDYSRMQVWFLGGVVLNHLVSALDAAITARFHNKKLYQTEVKWYDRVKLNSYVSLKNNNFTTHLNSRVPF